MKILKKIIKYFLILVVGLILIFYILGGVSAAFLQAFFSGGVDVPMIGASGCIAGIMGAYYVLYPKAKINVFLWFFIFIQFIKVPANIVLLMWIIGHLFRQLVVHIQV